MIKAGDWEKAVEKLLYFAWKMLDLITFQKACKVTVITVDSKGYLVLSRKNKSTDLYNVQKISAKRDYETVSV